jgi:MFS family permease
MKKVLKTIVSVVGVIAIIGMIYNLWAYSQLKDILVPENITLPAVVDNYTLFIILSFLSIAGFHLLVLFHTIYLLPRMQKNHFWGALFFCGVVLSGLLISSDAALLSDLGKEYLFWDVSVEWKMLTVTSSLQLTMMVIGLFILITNKEKFPFAWFPKAEKFDESMFRIVTLIGLISGLLGLLMLPLPQIMDVREPYRDGYLITLTILTILPFASSFIYWLIRNRGKKFSDILDEKQFQDISFGGLLAVMIMVLLLIAGIFLSTAEQIDLNNTVYSLFAIDLIIIIISGTVLLRSRI